jgi:hypothetical protein
MRYSLLPKPYFIPVNIAIEDAKITVTPRLLSAWSSLIYIKNVPVVYD